MQVIGYHHYLQTLIKTLLSSCLGKVEQTIKSQVQKLIDFPFFNINTPEMSYPVRG